MTSTSASDLADSLRSLSVSTSLSKLPKDVYLCDTKASFSEGIAQLKAYRTLVLDCEGEELGAVGGAVSLIVVRGIPELLSSETAKTFLFDIVQLASDECVVQPLLDMLSSLTIRKVVYDGRMDYCAIWFGYGTAMRNVIDLQVVEIKRRISSPGYQKRLMAVYGPHVVNNHRMRGKRYI
ncbi:hypothetical protein PQX77_019513 [Marasmius sp. AFHP31]|nr:hypothetical protein PQX77_019513 [Marasmius sp. AFHP31]